MSTNMIKEIAKQVFWSLPYETRRILFKVSCPRAYQKLQALRTVEVGKGQTLMPFDKYQCIFVHIPKCAGISVCNSLFGGEAGWHIQIRKYQIAFTKSEFESYFKFTFGVLSEKTHLKVKYEFDTILSTVIIFVFLSCLVSHL